MDWEIDKAELSSENLRIEGFACRWRESLPCGLGQVGENPTYRILEGRAGNVSIV